MKKKKISHWHYLSEVGFACSQHNHSTKNPAHKSTQAQSPKSSLKQTLLKTRCLLRQWYSGGRQETKLSAKKRMSIWCRLDKLWFLPHITSKMLVFCLTRAGPKANRILDKNYSKSSLSGAYTTYQRCQKEFRDSSSQVTKTRTDCTWVKG